MSRESDLSQRALADAEATLREAEAALTNLDGVSPRRRYGNEEQEPNVRRPASGFGECIRSLVQKYAEMAAVLDDLRSSRGLLDRAASGQDVTIRQLAHASTVLQNIEARLVTLSEFFDIRGLGLEALVAGLPVAGLPVAGLEEVAEDRSEVSACD